MVESVRVAGIGRIRENIERLSGQVPEKGEYRKMEESPRVPKNCSGEYRKREESLRVPKNCSADYPKRIQSV